MEAKRRSVQSLFSVFVVDTSNLVMVRAQLEMLRKQVPLLYSALCLNTVLGVIGVIGTAPPLLTIWFPAVLIVFCIARTAIWLRECPATMSDALAIRRLRGIARLGGAIGIIYLAWAITLARYADTFAFTRITFAVALTALVCVTCLLHVRAAALSLTMFIVVPFTAFLFSIGELHFIVLGANLLLVAAAMVYVLLVASRDFEQMVRSRIETDRLGTENARLANVDSLTGLPNRRHFFDRLRDVLRAAGQERRPFAVGVLDVDGFKPINDVYGHVTGDRLLIEAGRRLERVAGARALVARLGGDEFGFIVFDAPSTGGLTRFGEDVCAEIGRPFDLPGVVANVSASIGFAVYPVAGGAPEQLYERADYALYFAKSRRRGQPVIFSDDHETQIREQGIVEQCLRNVDLDGEMMLHYQPLFDLERGRPVAFEALARWHSPELGVVSPAVFIPVAERTELIHRITHGLLAKALAAARTWPAPLHVAFNLSMRDLVSPESITRIEAIVRDSGIDPSRIEFEMTESALMADFDQAVQSIHRLRGLGARLSLDDFGTGYSSLSHVHRLPLDQIKIDRSFVVDVETRQSSRDILRAVLDLCDNLRIDCVVEGAETARQVEILRGLGCRVVQGYHFARPMPQEGVLPFLASLDVTAAEPAPATVRGGARQPLLQPIGVDS